MSIETAQSNLDCKVLESLPDKLIMAGWLDLSSNDVESAQAVAKRVRKASQYMRKENLILAPDCGMKYLLRDVAFGKMRSMVEAAKLLREEFT